MGISSIIEKIFLYKNTGTVIKRLANILYVICLVGLVLMWFIGFMESPYLEVFLGGIMMVVIGGVIAYFLFLLTAAFGELVENTTKIVESQEKILAELRKVPSEIRRVPSEIAAAGNIKNHD